MSFPKIQRFGQGLKSAWPQSRWALAIAMLLLAACGESGLVSKGPPPVNPVVRISGPPDQLVSLGVAHFEIDGGTRGLKELRKAFSLPAEGTWEMSIDNGYDGLAIDLVVPTDEAVTLELLLEGETFHAETATTPSRLRIVAGKTDSEDEIAWDVRPENTDREVMQAFVDGMVDGTVGDLIATDREQVAIEAGLLTEMMKIAIKRFGPIKNLHPDRWSATLSNDEELSLYRVPIEFEDGTFLRLVMYVDDGRLVAVTEKNPDFEKDWWVEAAYGETYQALGEALVADVVQGHHEDAHARLGAEAREKLSLQQVKDYREQFPKLPDSGIREIAPQDQRTIDENTGSDIKRHVQQGFLVTFEGSEDKCIARVNYAFSVGAGWKTVEIIGYDLEPR